MYIYKYNSQTYIETQHALQFDALFAAGNIHLQKLFCHCIIDVLPIRLGFQKNIPYLFGSLMLQNIRHQPAIHKTQMETYSAR